MQSSNIPVKFPMPFAAGAGVGYINAIPAASQIPITPGAASLTDGFPPLNDVPVASGGIPPSGADMNGILNQISAWNQWQNVGGAVQFDSALSTSIGGYPKGASVASSTTFGLVWLSITENNTTNPDSGGAGWVSLTPNYQKTILADTGAVNTYSAVNPIPLTTGTLIDGVVQSVRFAHTNTGASTYSPDGLTAKPIYGLAVTALTGGEAVINRIGVMIYDSTLNAAAGAWVLIASSGGAIQVPNGSYGTTQAINDSTKRLATDEFVQNQLAAIVFFATGTRMPFAQAAAPTGWTQDVSDNANNRMLRVISSTGGGVGGNHDPSTMNVVPAHTHSFTTGYVSSDHAHSGTTLTENAAHNHSGTTGVENADHSHGYLRPQSVADTDRGVQSSLFSLDNNEYPQTTGASNSHVHGFTTNTENQYHAHDFTTGGISANHTHSGSTDNGSSQTNWTPRYINMIICTKN